MTESELISKIDLLKENKRNPLLIEYWKYIYDNRDSFPGLQHSWTDLSDKMKSEKKYFTSDMMEPFKVIYPNFAKLNKIDSTGSYQPESEFGSRDDLEFCKKQCKAQSDSIIEFLKS